MNKDLKETLEEIDALKTKAEEVRHALEKATTEEETRSLNDEAEQVAAAYKKAVEKKEALDAVEAERRSIENVGGTVVKTHERGKKMELNELLNSHAYACAYANYVKTGKDAECRAMLEKEGIELRTLPENALLTTNATGGNNTVPVPTIVSDTIKKVWDDDPIMSRVNDTEIRGNLTVGFEFSTTDAVDRKEGETAAEGKIELGNVTLIPSDIVKWIRVSNYVLDMNGEAFLTFIYNELAHRIAKKAADKVIAAIKAAPETATKTTPSVAKVESTGIADFINAIAKLSDEAVNPVAIMHKSTYAYYKSLALASNYAVDPFEGMTVLFNNTLTPANGVATGDYAIVGDLNYGITANFPVGKNVKYKFDDLTDAEDGLVRVFGTLTESAAVVADKAFCRIVKA